MQVFLVPVMSRRSQQLLVNILKSDCLYIYLNMGFISSSVFNRVDKMKFLVIAVENQIRIKS